MLDSAKPLWQASACDLAEAIAARAVSCEEAVGAAVERMRAVNPRLNAVVDDLGDEAMAEARAADRRLAERGTDGPLHGLPVTVKVNVDQKGRATTNGVAAWRDLIAPDDAPIVRNLKRAGAIIIGRTNTPEFSFRATTVNELHGRTLNPWDDEISPGGSSGGASSAVMAGMCTVAHGNDIGGSLRFPAYCTGAATVKPGLGRTPAWNPSAPAERGPLSQIMSVQGPICREVRDVRLAMEAMVAYDPHDPWQVAMPLAGPSEGPLKVALSRDTLDFPLHPAVAQALENAAGALADAGYEVLEAEPPMLREVGEEAAKCLFGETLEMMGEQIEAYGSATVKGIFACYTELFEPYRGHDLLLAMARRSKYVRAWTCFLAEYPLILTPFLPGPPYRWNRDEEGIEGARDVLGAAFWSYSMNFMGLPAGNVPAHLADGLPIGVQIVGRRFREDQILDACETVERRAGVMADRLFARG